MSNKDEVDNVGMSVHNFKAPDKLMELFVKLSGKRKSTGVRELVEQFVQDPRNMKHDLEHVIELDKLLSVCEISEKLDVHENTVLNWIHRDNDALEKYNFGGIYLVHITDLLEFIDAPDKLVKDLQKNGNFGVLLQKYKTPLEIENQFGIPRYKISRLKKQKRLRVFKIGKTRYLVHEDSIKFYLEQQQKVEVQKLDNRS